MNTTDRSTLDARDGTPCNPPPDAPVFVLCESCSRVLRAARGGATDLDNRHRAPVHCDGVSVPGKPRGWRCRGSCLPAPRVVAEERAAPSQP